MTRAPAAQDAPVFDAEAEALLRPPASGAVVLAVSGGSDSIALMLLAARNERLRQQGLSVATVDHGLRASAQGEAALVADWAARLGLPHVTLPWLGDKPPSAIQERARAARYALLADHARRMGAGQIATAHHGDDQAETVLMRLIRGSGPAGLAAMRPISQLGELLLWRPFLTLPKARLTATVALACHPSINDPSNTDPRYMRARLRMAEHRLSDHAMSLDVLTPRALLKLAERAARAEDALEAQVEAAVVRHIARGVDEVSLCPGLWREPPEIQLRLLRRAIGDQSAAPLRLERLERLHQRLHQVLSSGASLRASIGGTVVSLDSLGKVTIREEKKRQRGRSPVDGSERCV
jgi:tRNA(Ile)-lysidine synthase